MFGKLVNVKGNLAGRLVQYEPSQRKDGKIWVGVMVWAPQWVFVGNRLLVTKRQVAALTDAEASRVAPLCGPYGENLAPAAFRSVGDGVSHHIDMTRLAASWMKAPLTDRDVLEAENGEALVALALTRMNSNREALDEIQQDGAKWLLDHWAEINQHLKRLTELESALLAG